MGRPTKYTPELGDSIAKRMYERSLSEICRDDEDVPHRVTVTRWMADNPDFATKCARAREEHAEFYVDEIISISDETPTHDVPDPDGGTSVRVDPAGIQRNKLRVDARKWYASKVLPKKYGEKSAVELSGPDGGSIPVSLEIDL